MRAMRIGWLVVALSCLAGPAYAWPPAMLQAGGDGSAPAPFPVPESLRSAVSFWRELFTRHASDRVVIHDREQMDVIWRVVELPKDERGVVLEAQVSKHVRGIALELQKRLHRLEGDPTPKDSEDQVLLALAGQNPERLAGAHARLRSQRGVADHFQAGLERYRQWALQARTILVEEGVPTEILVLPFVESMWNPLARSSAGAAGLWQLMPATARGLGLKVQAGRDERFDVFKATRAAAKMLRQNYRMLGSWPLAITAYNHGPNGVRRAVQQVGSTDLMQLIDNYNKSTWGFASKNFYAEFLAALAIMDELSAPGSALAASEASGLPSVRE